MLTFPNVTPEVFALVLDQLRAEARIEDIGTGYYSMHGHGISANVSYANGQAMVDILSKPFFMSEGMIGAKIRDAIALAQQAVAKAGQGGGDQAA